MNRDINYSIEAAINNEEVRSKINSVISKNQSSKKSGHGYKESILENLRNDGVIDLIMEGITKIMQPVNIGNTQWLNTQSQPAPGNGLFLNINFLRLFNISPHLTMQKESVNEQFENDLKTNHKFQQAFQIYVSFRKQRLVSDLIPCFKRDVDINQMNQFIKLVDTHSDEPIQLIDLVELREPVHLVIIKHNFLTNQRLLITSQVLEWRWVLCHNGWSCRANLDLYGVFDENKMNVASLEIGLEMTPPAYVGLQKPMDRDILTELLHKQNLMYGSERERKFLLYSKQWWTEYVTEDSSNQTRRVKLFAQDENGCNRFVCDYIYPLRAGRILDSPLQAGRFVSSIPVHHCDQISHESVTNEDTHNLWKSGMCLLVENVGNAESHAVLLCSLLLGYGLDAYVAIGTVTNNEMAGLSKPHVWVITLQQDQVNRAWFWEPCTGKKVKFQAFPQKPPIIVTTASTKLRYRSIGCLFNHFQFFANTYKNDSIEMILFDLTNTSRWKGLSENVISNYLGDRSVHYLRGSDHVPLHISRLIPSTENPIQLSNDLEHQLRCLVSDWRANHSQHSLGGGSPLTTRWDDQLCYILGQALFSYEQEQLTGVANLASDEFKATIQRHVVEGHTFKAYPLHVFHLNARYIFDTALKSPIFMEIINCRGSEVCMSLRVRVFNYAEYSTPTWVIFGCTYVFGQQ